MGVFKTDKDLYECIGGLFKQVQRDAIMGPKLKASNLTICFNYTDPDSKITVDCKTDPIVEGTFINLFLGDEGNHIEPEVNMSMSADIAHKFWFGKVNLLSALTLRQMIAKGPIPKILKLLPVIKPTYTMYPKFLEEIGKKDLVDMVMSGKL